jgi:hypothetical protein
MRAAPHPITIGKVRRGAGKFYFNILREKIVGFPPKINPLILQIGPIYAPII